MSSGHTLQQVLEALQQLYQNPDPNVKKGANEWLQEFQHSVSQVVRFPLQTLLDQ